MKQRRLRLARLQLVDWMVRHPRWTNRPGPRRDPGTRRDSRGRADFFPRITAVAAGIHKAAGWRRWRFDRARQSASFMRAILALPRAQACTWVGRRNLDILQQRDQ
jgi:hypothetical protein